MDDITTPATEIEIAALIDSLRMVATAPVAKRLTLVIRKLAFERDMLKECRKEMEQAVISAASSIIDNWDDWDAEAGQAAQQDQDDRTWRHVMLTHIVSRLWREFGWPMEDK